MEFFAIYGNNSENETKWNMIQLNLSNITYPFKNDSESKVDPAWEQAATQARYWVGIWMLVVSCTGTPANLLVLDCSRRILRLSRDRLVPLYFVYSMTLADLSFTCVYASAMFSLYSLHTVWSTSTCGLIYGICHCSSVASSMSLFCLNIDKFVAITRPLQHASIMTPGRVLRLIGVCWGISICWALFFVTSMISSSEGKCGELLAPFGYYCLFTLLFFIGPTVAAFCLSLCISMIAWKRPLNSDNISEFGLGTEKSSNGKIKLRFGGKNSMRSPLHSTSTTSSDPNRKSSAHNRPPIRPVRTLTFVFATTAWSFLTCVPYRIMYLFYIRSQTDEQLKYFYFTFALFGLMATNSLGNPIITILTQRRYIAVLLQSCRKARNQFGQWRRTLQISSNSRDCGQIDCAVTPIALQRQSRNITVGIDIEERMIVGSLRSGKFQHSL